MAGEGPLTAAEVSSRSGTDERYVQEWLDNQAAGGYVTYDKDAKRYELPPEQAMALADEDSPAFVGGGYAGIVSAYIDVDKFVHAFRTGEGVGWQDHDPRLFRAPSGSSSPATGPRSCPTGCPRSTAWSRSSSGVPGSPTSAAATAPRR